MSPLAGRTFATVGTGVMAESMITGLIRGRLLEPGKRVVIGQRERADAERVRVLDERSGRERPVGGRRMAVEIGR